MAINYIKREVELQQTVAIYSMRRRATLEPSDRARRHRLTEIYLQLDKCLQIPSDDKLLLRKHIQLFAPQILQVFDNAKRDKNIQQLQLQIRKIVAQLKLQEKHLRPMLNGQLYSRNTTPLISKMHTQKSQPTSNQNSLRNSPEGKKRTIIDFDITEVERSLHAQFMKNGQSLRKDKEVVIDRSPIARAITPKKVIKIERGLSNKNLSIVSSRKLADTDPKSQNTYSQMDDPFTSNLKQLVKNKMKKDLPIEKQINCRMRLLISRTKPDEVEKSSPSKSRTDAPLTLSIDPNNFPCLYLQHTEESCRKTHKTETGTFYRRIREVIQGKFDGF